MDPVTPQQQPESGNCHHLSFAWVDCPECPYWVFQLTCCCGDVREWHAPNIQCAADK